MAVRGPARRRRTQSRGSPPRRSAQPDSGRSRHRRLGARNASLGDPSHARHRIEERLTVAGPRRRACTERRIRRPSLRTRPIDPSLGVARAAKRRSRRDRHRTRPPPYPINAACNARARCPLPPAIRRYTCFSAGRALALASASLSAIRSSAPARSVPYRAPDVSVERDPERRLRAALRCDASRRFCPRVLLQPDPLVRVPSRRYGPGLTRARTLTPDLVGAGQVVVAAPCTGLATLANCSRDMPWESSE